MSLDHNSHGRPEDSQRTITRAKVVMIGFLLVIAYLLWTEHRAHVIQFLPFLLLAACPLMHVSCITGTVMATEKAKHQVT